MKKELSPAAVWGIIGVVVVLVVFIGYRMLGPVANKADTKGSEDLMKKVNDGGKMYEPPGTFSKRGDGGTQFTPPGQGGSGAPMGPPR